MKITSSALSIWEFHRVCPMLGLFEVAHYFPWLVPWKQSLDAGNGSSVTLGKLGLHKNASNCDNLQRNKMLYIHFKTNMRQGEN